MNYSLIHIVSIAFTILLLDFIWLYNNFPYYQDLFQTIQNNPLTIRWIPALLVYIIIIFSIVYFTKDSKTIYEAGSRGALLGLAMYGVYDLTNYATFSNYSFSMTVTDIIWGITLCGSASIIGFLINK
jgi:uncharacterized membrane protein